MNINSKSDLSRIFQNNNIIFNTVNYDDGTSLIMIPDCDNSSDAVVNFSFDTKRLLGRISVSKSGKTIFCNKFK